MPTSRTNVYGVRGTAFGRKPNSGALQGVPSSSHQATANGQVCDTHRWPRATVADEQYGWICECGNLKTDQALTCNECAVERRRAPDYWEQRTCACGGPKSKRAAMCRPCRNEAMRGVTRLDVGRPQPESHPWRQAETLRLARTAA